MHCFCAFVLACPLFTWQMEWITTLGNIMHCLSYYSPLDLRLSCPLVFPALAWQMGKLKRRIMPEDIVINIGKGATVPPCPIPGHK